MNHLRDLNVSTARLVAFLVAIVLSTSVGCSWLNRLPTDRELMAQFELHRAAFEALRDMAAADSGRIAAVYHHRVRAVGPSSLLTGGVEPPLPLDWTETRWDRYRELMREAGVRERIWIGAPRPRSEVYFECGRRMFWVRASTKGIVYTEEPPELLSVQLDGREPAPKFDRYEEAFRRLEGNWYIFVRRI